MISFHPDLHRSPLLPIHHSWPGFVIAAFPVYIAISAIATPLFQQRLDEKFQRGAEKSGFSVESVTAIEMLKSMAVSRRCSVAGKSSSPATWASSFRVPESQ